MNRFTPLIFFLFILFNLNAQNMIINKNHYSQQKPQFNTSNSEYPFCVGLSIGYSYMPMYLDFFPSSIPDYYNKLNSGISLNASAYYMLNENCGLGAENSFLGTSTSGRMANQTYTPPFFLIGSEKYRQYINYLGPSLLLQEPLDAQQKIIIRETLSAGTTFFRLEYQSRYPIISESGYVDNATNQLICGNSFSGKFGLSTEYRFANAVSVGIGGNFIMSLLKKVRLESTGSNSDDNYSVATGELEEPIELSRFDCSIIFRYYFGRITK